MTLPADRLLDVIEKIRNALAELPLAQHERALRLTQELVALDVGDRLAPPAPAPEPAPPKPEEPELLAWAKRAAAAAAGVRIVGTPSLIATQSQQFPGVVTKIESSTLPVSQGGDGAIDKKVSTGTLAPEPGAMLWPIGTFVQVKATKKTGYIVDRSGYGESVAVRLEEDESIVWYASDRVHKHLPAIDPELSAGTLGPKPDEMSWPAEHFAFVLATALGRPAANAVWVEERDAAQAMREELEALRRVPKRIPVTIEIKETRVNGVSHYFAVICQLGGEQLYYSTGYATAQSARVAALCELALRREWELGYVDTTPGHAMHHIAQDMPR